MTGRAFGTTRLAALLLLLVGCVGGDRVTKRLAVEHLRGADPIEYLGGSVRIFYAENTGAFLGLGDDWSPALRFWLLTIGTGAILIGISWMLLRQPNMPKVRFVAAALVLAGGIGNLIDRVRDGYVVDFMNLGLGRVRTGVFNVADIAITLGVVLLIWPLREEHDEDDEKPAPVDAASAE